MPTEYGCPDVRDAIKSFQENCLAARESPDDFVVAVPQSLYDALVGKTQMPIKVSERADIDA